MVDVVTVSGESVSGLAEMVKSTTVTTITTDLVSAPLEPVIVIV
jgi:hypothetical protein